MKNEGNVMTVIFVALILITLVVFINKMANDRDEKLMSLCADHQTQTLYECNE